MGASITAASIINEAADLLYDETNVRWPTDELEDYLNNGQREIVLLRPDAYPTREAFALVQTNTRQVIPSGGISLIDVCLNVDVSDVPSGRAITLIDREELDKTRPNWHIETEASEIKHFTFDPRNPKEFFVYPPPAAGLYVELIYAASPPDCAASGNAFATSHAYALGDKFTVTDYVYEVVKAGTSHTGAPSWPSVWKQAVVDGAGVIYQNIGTTLLSLDDIYKPALLDYVLARAYSKDAKTQRMSLVQIHQVAFMQALGLKAQVVQEYDPNIRNVPVNRAIGEAART